jgi:hypothetical protein
MIPFQSLGCNALAELRWAILNSVTGLFEARIFLASSGVADPGHRMRQAPRYCTTRS